jgi:2-keto-4-pentenoate hydratase/2-oxohepta-3-ene-1,7-dioic acid hydratase in catechol pathway
MKLSTIVVGDEHHLGVATKHGIVNINQANYEMGYPDDHVPNSIMSAIRGGQPAIDALETFISKLPLDHKPAYLLDEASVNFGPCVTEPSKIICVGLNYRKHAEETNAAIPEYPILFNKFANTLTAHGRDIAIPKVTAKLDYEAELVIVIGKKAKYVDKGQAMEHIFGYCCVNDLSARDLQLRTAQWLLGKTCDDFSPLGPYLVTADEVGDPNQLAIRTTVNGEIRQSSNTSDMIFYCDEIVSYISQHMTLEPGDIILTGTPEGVVLGYPPERQVYLKPGDEVTIEIEKLGRLTNRFIAE